jgi:hypothetical protein
MQLRSDVRAQHQQMCMECAGPVETVLRSLMACFLPAFTHDYPMLFYPRPHLRYKMCSAHRLTGSVSLRGYNTRLNTHVLKAVGRSVQNLGSRATQD